MSEVGSRIGHIRIDAELGTGGMGEVYRGFDERLQRPVAVKTIRARHRLSDDARARFLREARLLSKLDHPGICRVFDLIDGEEADYLVLEYIEGTTLRVAAEGGLRESEVLRIAEGIAHALAAAHGEHIVHRDLKPENVMLTRGGLVKVLDFGIARSLLFMADAGGVAVEAEADSAGATEVLAETAGIDDGASLLRYTVRTREGQILGTLGYMSPEQALGEPVSEASDLYSLGVMVQELATGKPAYEAASPVVLRAQVARAEVLPATGIDPDLGSLLKRLTQLDPSARPSARETAARLAWIAAKPQRVRARRLRIAAATVAGAAILGALGYGGYSRWQAGRQAEIARQFGEQARDIEWLLRAEHLSPAHDIRPAVTGVKQRMADLEGRMVGLGRLAEGPGHLALGRGWLALGDAPQARVHLEKAWSAGYRTPDVAYSLGVALGRLYQGELDSVRGIGQPELRALELARIQSDLRDPAIDYLRQAAGASGGAPEYVEALIALYEERFDDGLELAEGLAETSPWFYEARTLVGDLHFGKGAQVFFVAKDFAGAAAAWEQVRQAYATAAEVGRSDPAVQTGLCRAEVTLAREQLFSQEMPLDPAGLEASLAQCELAIRLDPDAAQAHSETGAMLVILARAQQRAGIDPVATYQRAVASTDRALALEADNRPALMTSGWVHQWLGWYLSVHGEDPGPALGRAVTDYTRLLELSPSAFSVRNNLGFCFWTLGLDAARRGEDPRPFLSQGLEVAQVAIADRPDNRLFHGLAFVLNHSMARWEDEHGGDAAGTFRNAIAALERSIPGESPSAEDHRNMALVRHDLGLHLLSRGLDPTTELRAAIEEAGRATAINPRYGLPQFVQGLAYLALARHAALTGGEPGTLLSEALDAYENGLDLSPDNVDAWAEQGMILLERARLELKEGQSPLGSCREALGSLEHALSLNPNMSLAWRTRGEVELVAARWSIRSGGSPAERLRAAESALGTAIEKNAGEAESFRALAELHLWRGRSLHGQHQSPDREVTSGLDAADRALGINPALATAQALRAELLLLRAETTADPEVAVQALRDAGVSLGRAVEHNPLLERSLRPLVQQLESSARLRRS